MKVYLAWVQIADWETTPEYIGVYSSREKAEQAILNRINFSRRNGEDMFLSLEIYNKIYEEKSYEMPFWYEVEKFELDKTYNQWEPA